MPNQNDHLSRRGSSGDLFQAPPAYSMAPLDRKRFTISGLLSLVFLLILVPWVPLGISIAWGNEAYFDAMPKALGGICVWAIFFLPLWLAIVCGWYSIRVTGFCCENWLGVLGTIASSAAVVLLLASLLLEGTLAFG
jgi:hypothetical protein